MKSKIVLLIMLALALTLPVATLMIAAQARAGRDVALPRPQGPCDIYGAAGTPCDFPVTNFIFRRTEEMWFQLSTLFSACIRKELPIS